MKQYIGIPYLTCGRDRNGIDCFGLVQLIYREQLGIELPEPLPYIDIPKNQAMSARSMVKDYRKRSGLYQPFDVLLLEVWRWPAHCGVVLENNWMLHSLKGHDSVMEKYDGLKWGHRHAGAFFCEDVGQAASLSYQLSGGSFRS